ncbi:Rha family transcriptional regulator [Pseudomonas sp. FP1742]|uniref:Rha family transcriptional regulator n=1 Tax=Pseudomonas sp. FP1742 TaxID=2954079 RepID=UPI002735057D|nr:Rha family transcriptional regulator [Pseudomonas sp. FP1742]WLG51616.1 Rha family transcriptional regulator [Pseudomonas sp. FP1742]
MKEMINTTAATFEKINKAGVMTPTTINGLPGMSSLEIAEITGKRHDRVLKDARKMLEELGLIGVVKTDASSFVETSYQNSQNKAQPMVILDKELTFTLITGYSVKLRHLIVKRWLELEGVGFEHVSVQATVVHLIEREKDNRQAALHAIKKAIRKAPRCPLSPAEKEVQRLRRLAYRNSQRGL